MTIAMHPVLSDPAITIVWILILGGPTNSVLKLDNARARRITYNQIPAGHPIFSLKDGTPKLESAIKTCRSTGDPHFTSFGGATFNFHGLGWNLLYEKGDLKVEARHEKLPGTSTSTIALNAAVKVTHRGIVYDFANGTKPEKDSFFDSAADELVSLNNPTAKVTVKSRYFFRGLYMHNIFVTTSATMGAKGLCADESDEAQTASVAVDPVVIFNANAITEEKAQEECEELQGTEAFEDCVFDLRMAATTIAEDD